jgi:hypothetical protein
MVDIYDRYTEKDRSRETVRRRESDVHGMLTEVIYRCIEWHVLSHTAEHRSFVIVSEQSPAQVREVAYEDSGVEVAQGEVSARILKERFGEELEAKPLMNIVQLLGLL